MFYDQDCSHLNIRHSKSSSDAPGKPPTRITPKGVYPPLEQVFLQFGRHTSHTTSGAKAKAVMLLIPPRRLAWRRGESKGRTRAPPRETRHGDAERAIEKTRLARFLISTATVGTILASSTSSRDIVTISVVAFEMLSMRWSNVTPAGRQLLAQRRALGGLHRWTPTARMRS